MQKNLVLVGPPGCGKSTIGKIIAKSLNKRFLDIDDYMEAENQRTVASILDELGDDKFLDFEAEQTLNINVENYIISTTGSSPLRPHAMQHLHKNGILIYIDAPLKMIEERLERMKVDRIVGMKTQSISEILRWRKETFYDTYTYDIHIKLQKPESSTIVAGAILEQLGKTKYSSTRGEKTQYSFTEAILQGIAHDGGLLVPQYLPRISQKNILELRKQTYPQRASSLFKYFGTGFSFEKSQKIAEKAYGKQFDDKEIVPLKKLKKNQYILELWHGPTSAFKDMALQFKPLCFAESIRLENQKRAELGKNKKEYLILTATSGDTGKAALEGYKNRDQIKIAVLYPNHGVSEIQRKQMLTQTGKNLEIYGIDGNFDDAQNIVKQIFNDTEFNADLNQNNLYLSSANSINWGRILPQIFYYVSAYCDLLNKNIIQEKDEIDLAVPTGNFGNILAGYYAKKMGIPIDRLICASNQNNVLTDFIQTGIYDLTQRDLVKTPSPSMDILISSNLERLLYEITNDSAKIKKWMQELKENLKFEVDAETLAEIQKHFFAGKCENTETLKTIKKIYTETNCLIDPHTAVVQNVVEDYLEKTGNQKPVVIASTAHWAKFASDVYRALHELEFNQTIEFKDEFEILEKIAKETDQEIPENLANLKNQRNLHNQICGKDIEGIKTLLKNFAL